MKIGVFTSRSTGTVQEKICTALYSVVPDKKVDIINSFQDFSERIRAIPSEYSLLILLAENDNQLSEFIDLKMFFDDTHIIVILNSENSQLISKAHLLRPIFIDYSYSNFNDVKAILEKVIHFQEAATIKH